MSSPSVVVQPRSSASTRVVMAASALLAVALAVGMYLLGEWRGGFNRVETAGKIEAMQQEIERLGRETREQQEEAVRAERIQLIDREAYSEVRQSLMLLQEENLELREQVEFYRGIVSPSERSVGLNVESFKLYVAGEENLFRYELVLTQVLNNDRLVSGGVTLTLKGVADGELVEKDFRALSPNDSVKAVLRFRYFQRLAGDIRLPDGFVPREVEMTLAPKGRKKVEQTFPWQLDG